jgi:hypothetical protein
MCRTQPTAPQATSSTPSGTQDSPPPGTNTTSSPATWPAFPLNPTPYSPTPTKPLPDSSALSNPTPTPSSSPWGAKGRRLCEEICDLRNQNRSPSRTLYRRVQQFTAQVYDGEWQHLKPSLSFHYEEAFAILDHHQNDYHPKTGQECPGVACVPDAFYL